MKTADAICPWKKMYHFPHRYSFIAFISISNYKDTVLLKKKITEVTIRRGDAIRLNRAKLHSAPRWETLQQVTFGACKRLQCSAGSFNRAVRHCKKSKTACHLPSPSPGTVPGGGETDTWILMRLTRLNTRAVLSYIPALKHNLINFPHSPRASGTQCLFRTYAPHGRM